MKTQTKFDLVIEAERRLTLALDALRRVGELDRDRGENVGLYLLEHLAEIIGPASESYSDNPKSISDWALALEEELIFEEMG